MLFFQAKLVLLLALCCVSMATRYSSSAETTVDLETTTETPITCAPNCYSEIVCEEIAQVATVAASLEKALGIELRHQLRLLRTSKSNRRFSVCNITEYKWYMKSDRLIQKLQGSAGPSCNLRLPFEALACAAFVKLSECAVSHLRIAYSSQQKCLPGSTHGRWLNVMESVGSVTSLLDNLYQSEPSSHRQTEWEGIKSSIARLEDYGGLLTSRHSVGLNRQADVDEGWFNTEEFVFPVPPLPSSVLIPDSGYLTQEGDVDETWRSQSTDYE